MYKVLHNDVAVAVTETINEAILVVQTLEAGLDRLTQHSPYTIVKAWELRFLQKSIIIRASQQ